MMIYAQFETGNTAEARKTAERLASMAKTAEDRAQADQLLKYVDGDRSNRARTADASAADQPDRALVLERREGQTPGPVTKLAAKRPSVTGSFVELDCEGSTARVVLRTGTGKSVFLIQDPKNIQVIGPVDKAATMDLTCGPQKPVSVRIEFEPAPSNIPNIDGLLRVIQFNSPDTNR